MSTLSRILSRVCLFNCRVSRATAKTIAPESFLLFAVLFGREDKGTVLQLETIAIAYKETEFITLNFNKIRSPAVY